MSLKRIFNAFRNLNNIKEGVVNSIFTKEDVEPISKGRMKICYSCSHLDSKGSKCLVPGTQPCCSECGCSLNFKTRSLSSSCPKGYWLAVMSEEEEEKMNSDADI